jgi:hypothetical protein
MVNVKPNTDKFTAPLAHECTAWGFEVPTAVDYEEYVL